MSRLTLDHLCKSFGRLAAVDEVSLTLVPGEFVALVGGSGCGKTTLLRIVAGFVQADRGRVLVDGAPIDREPPHRRGIGFVFQSYALFPTMTVADNIGFSLRIRGAPKPAITARIAELCAVARLQGLEDRYPHELSGGQQQRVALMRALAPEPRILLLDEPLAALDAQIRATLRHEIRTILGRLGMTALYVTHDQEEALSIADRVAVMAQGRLLQVDRPIDIYLRPGSLAVASFIGSINRFAVRVQNGTLHLPDGRTLGRTPSVWRGDGPATVCVRPEQIEISSPDRPHDGFLAGRIAEASFLGAGVRLRIDGGLGDVVHADLPVATWLALGLGVGAAIAWRPRAEGLLLFADDGA